MINTYTFMYMYMNKYLHFPGVIETIFCDISQQTI